ncbi:MAG: hypothetical protein KAU50_00520 [Candidatus Marinimicrobia bacterium]|nr:hypothetical protein [Candidatus Neomarinimicrobiota bacterium]
MRFLVAISSPIYSERTLQIGSSIAEAFKAELSVVYVGDRPKALATGGVNLARDAMLNWDIHHPGVDVLRWAYSRLQEYEFIDADAEQFDPKDLVEDDGRLRVVVPHTHGEKIRLILREGDPVEELKQETNIRDYPLTIVGGGSRKRLTRQLIQFIDTSLLFVKNFDVDKKYKLLLCVDDSAATRRAVMFCGRVAQALDTEVMLVTASKTKGFGPGYSKAAAWAKRYMERLKIAHTQEFVTGDPATTFVRLAGSDHIIVMGKSKMHPLKAWLTGTKPGDTVLKADSPAILVK